MIYNLPRMTTEAVKETWVLNETVYIENFISWDGGSEFPIKFKCDGETYSSIRFDGGVT